MASHDVCVPATALETSVRYLRPPLEHPRDAGICLAWLNTRLISWPSLAGALPCHHPPRVSHLPSLAVDYHNELPTAEIWQRVHVIQDRRMQRERERYTTSGMGGIVDEKLQKDTVTNVARFVSIN